MMLSMNMMSRKMNVIFHVTSLLYLKWHHSYTSISDDFSPPFLSSFLESDLTWSDITRTVLVSVMVGNANTDLAASVQLCTRGSVQAKTTSRRKFELGKWKLDWNHSDRLCLPRKSGKTQAILQSSETATEARAISRADHRTATISSAASLGFRTHLTSFKS